MDPEMKKKYKDENISMANNYIDKMFRDIENVYEENRIQIPSLPSKLENFKKDLKRKIKEEIENKYIALESNSEYQSINIEGVFGDFEYDLTKINLRIEELLRGSDLAGICKSIINSCKDSIISEYRIQSRNMKKEIDEKISSKDGDTFKEDYLKLSKIESLSNDEDKLKIIETMSDEFCICIAVKCLEHDENKIKFIKQDKLSDAAKSNIIENLSSEMNRVNCLRYISKHSMRVLAIKYYLSDKYKSKILEQATDGFRDGMKEPILFFSEGDEFAIVPLMFGLGERCGVISSLKSDELKLKYLEGIASDYERSEIIVSLSSKEERMKLMETVNSEACKRRIERTLTAESPENGEEDERENLITEVNEIRKNIDGQKSEISRLQEQVKVMQNARNTGPVK